MLRALTEGKHDLATPGSYFFRRGRFGRTRQRLPNYSCMGRLRYFWEMYHCFQMLLPNFSKGTALKLDCLFHLKSFRQIHDAAYREGHVLALFVKFC